MGTENLDKIFNPRRIAVIGASIRDNSVGAKLLKNLVGVGYNGAVYPVNPFRPIVQGITAYPNISRIPRQVDLAIVATPAHTVPQIIQECGEAGVSGIIIVSAGFKEAGEEGKNLEKQILEYKKSYNIRVIGPNSLGVIRPKIRLNATFANRTAKTGRIAFISQSAALCASVLDWASEANVGFSAVVSVGSTIDVDLGDLIDYFGTDIETSSIVLYLESIRNARKFMSAARGFARAKPIVVVKAGRFKESAEAALCHTGALVGEDGVYDAAFRRAGVIRVEAINDLFSCAEALAMQPNPKGPNLTIITNAGGPGIMATDLLISKGGKLSPLSDKTITALKEVLPSYCSLMNPIDILEEANVERFRKVMEICFKDSNSNGFLIIYTPQGAADPVETANIIVELAKQTKKPVLTSLMGEEGCWGARKILRKNGVPTFITPEQSVSTFMYMYHYTKNLELLYETPEGLSVEVSKPEALKTIIKDACDKGRKTLTLPESLKFLEAYGIPTVKSVTAKSSKKAVEAASRLGYPVVLKALSPKIVHKLKAGAISFNLWSPAQVKKTFNDLAESTEDFQGVIIQRMIKDVRCEVLIGSKRDPHFGPVIIFGMGGINVELLGDVNIGFPPLNQVLAKRLMERSSLYKVLSLKNTTCGGLGEILVRFSQLVVDFPIIDQMDINPLVINETGAFAVDAQISLDHKMKTRKDQTHEHLVIVPYPKKYVKSWKLKNGTPVVFRPIKPEDELLLRNLFQSFSEETIRFRFFQLIKDMPHETLTRYCNVDYNREIAIVAEEKEDSRRIIGVSRLIVQPGQNSGEFAVVVGDEWHGQGLGSKLVDHIIQIAKDIGLEMMCGDILKGNLKMTRLCTKKGFDLEPVDEDTVKAVLNLP
ncbi:MAG: bifunctional acetate--CoA ligase family protein/GNAT family N-acetyltransferase [Candidatus Bathyarchaeota archaeon]|jgi:acetyltransferase